ncbi:nucleotidyltransferase domain-containing protein [Candidatus Woesearchaeota archaeon]|nr:nucleotidyltransferase domain-containing protein [Candidatus Woesearchaeota archaeon]
MDRDELISQIYSFISYLFRESNIKINRIFLFGSVARGDFDEESDIDIFIDVDKKNEKPIGIKAYRALNRFYEIEGEKWKLKGIKNKISLKVGALDEWELKSSIEMEGIVLYSTVASSSLKKYFLFSLPSITPVKKRNKVLRNLFGRKEKGYNDNGMISKYDGKVLSPKCFIISSEGPKEITLFLTKEKVNFSFVEIWK